MLTVRTLDLTNIKLWNFLNFRDKNGFEVNFIADWKHSCAIEVKSESFSENCIFAHHNEFLESRSKAFVLQSLQ